MTKKELFRALLCGSTMQELLPLIQGQECLIYKADKFSISPNVIYVPDVSLNEIPYGEDLSDDPEAIHDLLGYCYTGLDFLNECNGNAELAERLFWYCDWQHPSSALPEVEDDEEAHDPSPVLEYSDMLEEVVTVSNIAGFLEAEDKIYVPDDTALTDAIVEMLNKRIADHDESNFHEWAQTELIKRFKFVSEIQSIPDVTKFIALHTSHIFADTLKALRNDAVEGVVCYRKDEIHGPEEYGVWVYIQADWADMNIPQDLEACIEYAKKFDCDWIMFDYDVEPVKDLTVWY